MNEMIARDGYWLTQKQIENEDLRFFAKRLKGVAATTNFFVECTNEEKEQWEAEHPQPTPEEI